MTSCTLCLFLVTFNTVERPRVSCFHCWSRKSSKIAQDGWDSRTRLGNLGFTE